MDDQDLRAELAAVHRKLDDLLAEVAAQRRQRQELEDLKDDLMRVGKDLFQTAVVELDGMHDSLSNAELLHLGKKLLRNVGTINAAIDQLESLRDFLVDVAPLARESVIDFMAKLDELDRKGYFVFAGEIGKLADTVVTNFSPEEVRALGDNLVTILNTVKGLTQPELLQTVNTAVGVYRKLDIDVEHTPSFFRLLRELASPEVRRGLAFLLAFTKKLAEKN